MRAWALVGAMAISGATLGAEPPAKVAAPPVVPGPASGPPIVIVEPPPATEVAAPLMAADCDRGFWISGDYLFLQPRWQGMELGIQQRRNSGVPDGAIQALDFDPGTGYRLTFGYDADAQTRYKLAYTYLSVETGSQLAATPGTVLLPTLTHPIGVREALGADGFARYKQNQIDLMVSRAVTPDKDFSFRVEGGTRFAYIDQEFNVDYNGAGALLASRRTPFNFEGAGLIAGFSSRWACGGNIAVFGGAWGSLLSGRTRVRTVESDSRLQVLLTDAEQAYHSVVPVADVQLGLAYETSRMKLALGYQFQEWFGLADQLTFADDVHVGRLDRRTSNVGLEGLFVRLGISF